MTMKLNAVKRTSLKKSDVKKIRRSGGVPGILYSRGRDAEPIFIQEAEFSTAVRTIPPGQLSTKAFTLVFGSKERKAIVKDIHYEPTTYIVSHLDFEELLEDVPVVVRVPIACTGVAECMGVKQMGGVLRQVTRHVQIRCLPRDIPSEFSVDVADLGMRQSRRLEDLTFPPQITPLTPLKEVLVVVAKR